jgi:GntR family transcriptional regulator
MIAAPSWLSVPILRLDCDATSVLLSYDRYDMVIQLNFKSGKPVYLQVVDQVKAAAASGFLQPGEALPCIRPLAETLRVNRNTIAKAYAELESLGVIETVPGKGCFLKEPQSLLRKDVRRKMLIEEIDQAIVQAHHLQVPGDEFLKLVRERMTALEDKRRSYEKKEGLTT